MNKQTYEITPASLKGLLLFASQDDSRPQMNGLAIKGGAFVATDGRRLISVDQKPLESEGKGIECLIVEKSLKQVMKAYKELNKKAYKENHSILLKLEQEDGGLATATMAGFVVETVKDVRLPDYRQVMVKKEGFRWPTDVFNLEYMLDAAKARGLIEVGIEDPTIKMQQNKEQEPAYYYNGGLKIILMPLRNH